MEASSLDASLRPPSFWRRFVPVWLAGLLGIGVLAAQPVPPALASAPELAGLGPVALRLVLALNPLVLMTLAAILGATLAPRTQLRSWLAGLHPAPVAWRAALGAGIVLGVTMAVLDALVAPVVGGAWGALVAQAAAPALLLGLAYGGMTEEVLLRWGGLAVTLWVFMRLLGNPGRDTARSRMAAWGAITVLSFAFAAGHLPALMATVVPDTAVVARTLLFNLGAGLVYGYLAYRRSLESAMVAHASTHLGMAAARAMLA